MVGDVEVIVVVVVEVVGVVVMGVVVCSENTVTITVSVAIFPPMSVTTRV